MPIPTLRRWLPPLPVPLPLLLLLVSLALTAVAAYDAHRAVVSQNATVTRAMREFSSFAAWSYSRRVEDQITATLRESLGAVNHGDDVHHEPPVPRARDLARYLPWDSRCECHRTRFGALPRTLWAFRLGDSTLDVALNAHADPSEGWDVDQRGITMAATYGQRYSTAERSAILRLVTSRVHSVERPYRGFTLLVEPRVLGYTLMPTAWGDTMVYGAEYAPDDLRELLRTALDLPALLPATFLANQRNRAVVAVRVRDRRGAMVMDSDSLAASPYSTHLDLGAHFGALGLDLLVRPQQASAFVFGGIPTSHLPALLGVLALAAALSVVAVVQLRRETQLARMRSDFVANVSHELRTPLAQIRLFTETLRFGRAQTMEQRDWSLGHIERETARLTQLVDNVLRFSRIGMLDAAAAVPTDVSAEVLRIVEDFRPLAASRGVVLEPCVSPTPAVRLRPDALPRLLLNLLDNAVKYGPTGQTVRIDVAVQNGELEIAVTDQGPGVPVAERERVWEPFQRGRAGGSAAGSGIGLSVVRDVAAIHGGRAWVESARPDDTRRSGARFVVSLPLTAPMTPTGASANGAQEQRL